MEKEFILELIVMSDLLKPYQSNDVQLDKMVSDLIHDPTSWKEQKNIRISTPVESRDIELIYSRRLKLLSSNDEDDARLRDAILKLLRYCSSHHNSSIWNVTFNCTNHSYTVFCGQTESSIEIISLIMGKQIPNDFL